MPRIDIPFVVEQQHITQPTGEKLVSGGQNYFYATFKTNEIWEDISDVKAVFVRDAISKLISVTKTDDGFECQIPWEVMGYKGAFQVGIFGGDRLLTDYTYVIVKQGCVVEGEEPAPPTPDWFSEMEKKIENIPGASVTEETIAKVVEQYMKENPVDTLTDEEVEKIVDDAISSDNSDFVNAVIASLPDADTMSFPLEETVSEVSEE